MNERLKEVLEKSGSVPGPIRLAEVIGGLALAAASDLEDAALAGLGAIVFLHGMFGPALKPTPHEMQEEGEQGHQ